VQLSANCFLQNEDSDIVAKRQNAWILHTIEMHAAEPSRMHYLFGAISESSESSADRRRIALEKFLKLNDDYRAFQLYEESKHSAVSQRYHCLHFCKEAIG